jgi:hypothetical protein
MRRLGAFGLNADSVGRTRSCRAAWRANWLKYGEKLRSTTASATSPVGSAVTRTTTAGLPLNGTPSFFGDIRRDTARDSILDYQPVAS